MSKPIDSLLPSYDGLLVSLSFPGWLLDFDWLAGFTGLEHPLQHGVPFVTVEVDEVNPAVRVHPSELAQPQVDGAAFEYGKSS
jgi:hypothetical protein